MDTYLFNAGPQKDMQITSKNMQKALTDFCRTVKNNIGSGTSITLYPHRIVRQYWTLDIDGNTGRFHILLNIAGRFRLPDLNILPWPARLTIDVVDHVDAYWFAMYLAQCLDLTLTNPLTLSTTNRDSYGSEFLEEVDTDVT